MTSWLPTSVEDCPMRLLPGDQVQASISKRLTRSRRKSSYMRWTVIEAIELDEERQTVTASAPGLGSVRFTWYGGHYRTGTGHRMTFYFVPGSRKGY